MPLLVRHCLPERNRFDKSAPSREARTSEGGSSNRNEGQSSGKRILILCNEKKNHVHTSIRDLILVRIDNTRSLYQ